MNNTPRNPSFNDGNLSNDENVKNKTDAQKKIDADKAAADAEKARQNR